MVAVDIYKQRSVNADFERGSLKDQTNSRDHTRTKPTSSEVLDSPDADPKQDAIQRLIVGPPNYPYLQAGKRVLGLDGEVGKVARVLVGPDGDITHFVLSPRNWLQRREVLVPVNWISGEDSDGIRLNVSRSQLLQQPKYRADFTLASEIHQTLWQNRSLRITSEGIEISVRDAVVTLRGHASNSVSARLEGAIRAVLGVISVQNAIIADDELSGFVLQAIREDKRLHSEQIRSAVQQGIVNLTGSVSSAKVAKIAEQRAAAIPQVRGVASYLKIAGHDTQNPIVVQPRVGQDVFAKGKPIGKVSRVIINPDNRLVSRFILQGETSMPSTSWLVLAPEQWEVVVPARLIEWVTVGGILLKASVDEVRQLPELVMSRFYVPSSKWLPPFPYRSSDILLEAQDD